MDTLTQMRVLPLLFLMAHLPGSSPRAQGSQPVSGIHDFDFHGGSSLTLQLPWKDTAVDTIRLEPPVPKGAGPWPIRLKKAHGVDLAWTLSLDKTGRTLLSAPSLLGALLESKEYQLELPHKKGMPQTGTFVLLSRGYRLLGGMGIHEDKVAILTLPLELPEAGRILIRMRNTSPDLALHALEIELPPSWAQVKFHGDKVRLLRKRSTLVLDPPLSHGFSYSIYLDVVQKKGVGQGKESLRFQPHYSRSRWGFIRPPDPRSKREIVRITKRMPKTMTLPPIGVREFRVDSFGKRVTLRADANYRFVDGSGILSSNKGKERIKASTQNDGREIAFSVEKTGKKRSWKLIGIKVQILPEAFGFLRLYLRDGKTWLTQPFAEAR